MLTPRCHDSVIRCLFQANLPNGTAARGDGTERAAKPIHITGTAQKLSEDGEANDGTITDIRLVDRTAD
jgi:hypothetical protein